MPLIPLFTQQQLQAICNILGETSEGLTGTEIGKLLNQCSINDPIPGYTKRDRLFQALNEKQIDDKCANNVVNFILTSMDPVRYALNKDLFDLRREKLNRVLTFAGYTLGKDGKLRESSIAKDLSEAEDKEVILRKELLKRNVHPDVLLYCKEEFLQENYFHCVLEATKSVAEKIRQKSGLRSDGSDLIDQAFGLKSGPLLAFNSLQSESEQSEHTGLMNLMKGMFGLFRNPTAHAPKRSWKMKELDAFDLLTLVSLIHRRLDEAVPTGKHKS